MGPEGHHKFTGEAEGGLTAPAEQPGTCPLPPCPPRPRATRPARAAPALTPRGFAMTVLTSPPALATELLTTDHHRRRCSLRVSGGSCLERTPRSVLTFYFHTANRSGSLQPARACSCAGACAAARDTAGGTRVRVRGTQVRRRRRRTDGRLRSRSKAAPVRAAGSARPG